MHTVTHNELCNLPVRSVLISPHLTCSEDVSHWLLLLVWVDLKAALSHSFQLLFSVK